MHCTVQKPLPKPKIMNAFLTNYIHNKRIENRLLPSSRKLRMCLACLTCHWCPTYLVGQQYLMLTDRNLKNTYCNNLVVKVVFI